MKCPHCGEQIAVGEPLTFIQADVLKFVERYFGKHGCAPTHAEICERFGWSTLATASEHLRNLVDKGWLAKTEKYAARNYVPVGFAERTP